MSATPARKPASEETNDKFPNKAVSEAKSKMAIAFGRKNGEGCLGMLTVRSGAVAGAA
jgi:hypothetical protein